MADRVVPVEQAALLHSALRRVGFRDGEVAWLSPSLLVELGASRVADVRGTLSGPGATLSGPSGTAEVLGPHSQRWGFDVVEGVPPATSLVIDGLLDQFAHPGLSIDQDGVVLLWNKAFTDLIGVGPEDALGQRMCQATGATTQDCQALAERAFSGEYLVGERLVLGSGKVLSLTVSTTPDAAGPGRALLVTARDDTAAATAERRLEESQRHYRSLLASLRDVVFELDDQGRVVFLTPSWTALSGESPEATHGRLLSDYLSATTQELRATQGVFLLERTDGDRRWCDVSSSTEVVDGAVRTVGTITDATARVSATADLARSSEEARAASEAKSAFVARLSHEMRTPLNAVRAFAQMAELDTDDPVVLDSLGNILTAGDHLLELINDALDLAQVEAGRIQVIAEEVDLAEVVKDCLTLVAPAAAARGLAVTSDLTADARLTSDPRRVRQIVLNLVSNAVKYNTAGGSLHVHVTGPQCRVEVSDTGKGLSTEQVARLFTPFERLSAPQGVEGHGLGLALSSRLAQALGASIEVESTPGSGSTFSLVFAR